MPMPLSRTRIVQTSGRSLGAVSISIAERLAHLGDVPFAGRYESIALFTTGYRAAGQVPEAARTELPQLQIFARDIHALRRASRGGATSRPP